MADTSGAELLEFPKKDNRRFLHAVYRVGDLERSIKFYTEAFGMKLLRKRDVPEEKYSNAFLGFGPEESNFAVELTYNYGVDKYDIGTGFGHFAIATADVYKLAEDIKAKGGTITREPGPVKGGTSVIAFAKDPDGYLFELTERPHTPEPLCQRSSDFSLMAVLRLLALFLAFVAALPEVRAQQEKDEPYVGVNIGTDISNFLPPAQLVSFLKQQKVTHIRLYDADPDILKALSKSKIRVIISVPNNQILGIGSSNTTAANWIKRNVVAFYPDTLVSALAVGDEVLTTVPSLSSMLMPAIESLYSALVASNLHTRIKISTPHASNIILDPFPPSQAYFNETLSPVIVQLLRFLSRTNSPLMMNMYPYYVFMQNKGVVPLDNSLFKPLTPSKEMVDPNTLLHYTNVLDAMIDSAYSSMKNLNVSDVLVLVTETGWPSKGDSKEPYATIDNANTYNSNLIKHILDRSGTPFHPEVTSSVYIYELFNEDLRSSPVSEANWGLFYANSTPVYLLHVSGTGEFLANDTTNQTFCVAMDGVDGKTLQTALDWACGPGRANCSEIQPGESCYSPNNVKNHASYAFDSYYEKQGRAAGSCDFKGVAIITTTDPSHGLCVFPGSKIISNRTNTVVNSTNATSGVDPSRVIGTRPCNLLWGLILGIMFCLYVL